MTKHLYSALIFIVLLTPVGGAQQADSSGVIRLKVDSDSVSLQINNIYVNQDSSGNPLLPDTWFVLTRPAGVYEISFQREGYDRIDTNIIVSPGEVSVFEAGFLVAMKDTIKTVSGSAVLNIESDPDSASVIIETRPDTFLTPGTLDIAAGDHSFRAVTSGCDELTHNMTIEPDQIISLNFILAFTQPVNLTAEDLELEYKPTVPLKEEAEAEKQKEMFNNLAETFALIPLGQGVLARLLLGGETEAGANILIATGAGLMAGSYILGKIIPKRKLANIREYNEEALRINSEAKYHNKEVDSKVEARNSELLENWMLQNQDRGKVEITVE